MKISILGTGNVGGALARLWSQRGHDIYLAARDTAKAAALAKEFPSCHVVSAAALNQADVLALCLPWPAAQDALKSAGNLRGKVLIDCTNPLTADFSQLVLGGTTSAAEQIQTWQPQARVVKAFNTMGSVLLGNAEFGGQHADGFYCGDDAAAKQLAARLVEDAGLHPFDVGPLRNARYLESLAMLWIDMALHQKKGANFAFKIISR